MAQRPPDIHVSHFGKALFLKVFNGVKDRISERLHLRGGRIKYCRIKETRFEVSTRFIARAKNNRKCVDAYLTCAF